MRCNFKPVQVCRPARREQANNYPELLESRVLLSSALVAHSLHVNNASVHPPLVMSRVAFAPLVAQPAVSSFQVDDGTPQRSMVRSLDVQFNEPVILGNGAMTLVNNAGQAVPFTTSSSDQQNYLLSFNGSLPDGRYVLTVHAAGVSDSTGQMMAADQTYSFFRLFGDVDGDGFLNNVDYQKFNSTFGKHSTDPGYLPIFDYDGNGIINNVDYLQFSRRFPSAPPPQSTDVLTWHDDVARTGLNSTETRLAPANVNVGSFGKLFSEPVDGQQYAEPLYVSHLNMGPLGTHDVVFVATEHNSVYAFDADNPNPATGGGLLWHENFGPPATTPSPYIGGRYGPWTLVTPYIGIEGTPVIDRTTNTMYFDSFTNPSPGVYQHHIYALDITTGAERVPPVLVNATYPGNGAGGDGTTIPFIANRQQQRPALTLLNGIVYVAYGSFDDTDPHHGWILGYDAATLQLKEVWNSTPTLFTPPGPNAGEGPIWQSGAGLSTDGINLYAMTGNGDFNASLNDYADSFVKVSTANNSLTLSDYFTPYNQLDLTNADNDLGSAGPMVLPDSVGSAAHPHLLVGVGKQGIIFLLDRDNMGHYDPATDHVLQEVQLGSGAWSNPAYFNGRLYFHGVGDVLKVFSIANGKISTTPVAQATIGYDYPGATPNISSNGTSNGIIWDIQSGGVLHAYDASTLAELYNSNQAGGRDQLGSYVKFTSPTIADGKVFVGTADSLVVFGPRPQDSIIGTPGNDAITLKRSPDHQHIDWTLNAGGSAPMSGELPISDPAGLTITGNGGADTITLDSSNGDPLPNLLTLNGTFTIDGLAPGTVAAGQTIDIGASTVTIPYPAGATLLPAVQALLRNGYNGGAWNGTGIVSSFARANPQYGIADTDSANGGAPGQPANIVLLQPALVGDANQDGQVDQTDESILQGNLGKTGADWSQGDFDYSGTVDSSDDAILGRNLGHHRPVNLLANGDFSQGNTGFVSGYTYGNDLSVETSYSVNTNPTNVHSAGVASFGDHTTGSGLMLLVNGAVTPNVTVWQETVPVTAGTLYDLSGWARAWGGTTTDPSPAVLHFEINGQAVGSDFQLPAAVDHWSPFSSTWNSGAATTAIIRIVDLNTVAGGNDFALDDLSFAVPGPGPMPVNLAASYNAIGIVADGATFGGGLDGYGNALSANLLGSNPTWNGNTYNLGPVGANNVVQATGQTIALPQGNISNLTFLATAARGNQPAQVFTVNYTDGTSQSFTQGVSDWYTPQNYTGESIAVTMPYRDTNTGGRDSHTFNVYGYTFALNNQKTVASLTLPNNANVKVLAIDLA